MEADIMKLKSLYIEQLYDSYSYDIKFNEDLTLIYGSNGCGKTTVLNITEAIITGQIFKLFNYNFKQIVLKYYNTQNSKESSLKIVSLVDNISLKIEFNERCTEVKQIPEFEEGEQRIYDVYRIGKEYFNKYTIFKEIKDTFNYVYLPLNRSTTLVDEDDEFLIRRRFRRSMLERNSIKNSNKRDQDISMIQIEELVYLNCCKMHSKIVDISDEFRNEILKSSIDIKGSNNIDDLFKQIKGSDLEIEDIEETRTKYIEILKGLNLISVEEEKKYIAFFDEYIKDLEKLEKKEKGKYRTNLLLKFNEIIKMRNVVDLASTMEQNKAEARKSIDQFLDVVNEFIGHDQDEKKININHLNSIFFTTKFSQNPINIRQLSSGEKQIITFFANLILNVKSDCCGIFVADEPELSLHLSWQRILIEKLMQINDNIQLIFATHSPEIIGKHRDKVFKLEKIFDELEKE